MLLMVLEVHFSLLFYFRACCELGYHFFSCHSLLLSTSILNDKQWQAHWLMYLLVNFCQGSYMQLVLNLYAWTLQKWWYLMQKRLWYKKSWSSKVESYLEVYTWTDRQKTRSDIRKQPKLSILNNKYYTGHIIAM